MLDIGGKNASLCGDNAVGKTTTCNSFLWLLFGKNSDDRTSFKVKPQDEHGNDIHHLQTEVEAELSVDGKPLKLRKMLEEKWTKKRGSAEAELTGNTISYWWDDVPVKESEYKQRISELVDEGIFRMITNPLYFNTKLSWQERRKILLEMCGDLSDEQVIASDPKLSKLADILSGKSIDDYKKILNEKIKRLEKEKAGIPPRIDELTLSVPQLQPDYAEIETTLKTYKDELEGIELGLADALQMSQEYGKIQQVLSQLKLKQADVRARIEAESGADRKKLVDELNKLSGEKYEIEAQKAVDEHLFELNTEQYNAVYCELKQLREEWASLTAKQFPEPEEGSFICPTCGRELPEEAKETKLAEMKARFEENKKAELEKNVKQGKFKKSEQGRIESELTALKQKIADRTKCLTEIEKRIAEINIELQKPVAEPDYSSDEEYSRLQKQIKVLEAELAQPVEDKTSALLQRKREVQSKIDECNNVLSRKADFEGKKKRIEELKAEERQLAQQITELEGHKYLCEQFTVAKVNLLEDKINSRFRHVKFKMFEQQINGGIAETCQALVNTNGVYVPFDDANHAGKVNAGIDCINALCDYYGVRACIWIDFRESVSRIIKTDSQIINLVKSEPDKILRVVIE